MNDEFKANALSWGAEGQTWLEKIPTLINELEKAWSIKVLPPFKLSYNYVAPAVCKDGTPAVIKLGFPKDEEFKTEVEALKVFNGEGACQILKSDPNNSAILIEQITPGQSLASLDDDVEATKIFAQVTKKLHKPLPTNHTFITVKKWGSAMDDYCENFHSSSKKLPLDLVQKARQTYTQLIETSEPPKLVHGDLHHDNILYSDTHGWLAIDPKGIAAEPAYEVAAMIRNPYERLKNIPDLKPLLKSRIEILAQELDYDPQRILDWCFAQTVLSAIWSLSSPKGPEHALRTALALEELQATE